MPAKKRVPPKAAPVPTAIKRKGRTGRRGSSVAKDVLPSSCPGSMEHVCRELAKLPQASYVAMVTGSFDVFVEAICRDPADFRTFLTEDLHAIVGVLGAESFIILELHKLAYGWGVASADPAPRLLGGGKPSQSRAPASAPARPRSRTRRR